MESCSFIHSVGHSIATCRIATNEHDLWSLRSSIKVGEIDSK